MYANCPNITCDKLIVTGWTSSLNLTNTSKEKILQELNELKQSYFDLSKSFPELNDIVKENKLIVEYHMAYDDYGKVVIGLCSEIEGKQIGTLTK